MGLLDQLGGFIGDVFGGATSAVSGAFSKLPPIVGTVGGQILTGALQQVFQPRSGVPAPSGGGIMRTPGFNPDAPGGVFQPMGDTGGPLQAVNPFESVQQSIDQGSTSIVGNVIRGADRLGEAVGLAPGIFSGESIARGADALFGGGQVADQSGSPLSGGALATGRPGGMRLFGPMGTVPFKQGFRMGLQGPCAVAVAPKMLIDLHPTSGNPVFYHRVTCGSWKLAGQRRRGCR